MSSSQSTLIALDWGLKKVGVATADTSGIVITPREVWLRGPAGQPWSWNPQDQVDLSKLIQLYEAGLILLGQPLSRDGQETQSSRCAQSLAAKISNATQLKVVLIPEQLSSWEARHRQGQEDSNAAAILLESFFNDPSLNALRESTLKEMAQ